MTKKIFKNVFLGCLAVIISTIVIVFGVTYSFYGNELMKELHTELKTVSVGVEQNGVNYLKNLELGNDKRITWINSDGSVKYDTDASVNKMENHLNRQEIKEAILNGEGEAVRNSDTLSEKTMYCAKLLNDGTIIRVSTNQYSVWILLINMLQPFAIVVIISLVISYIAAYLASRKIVQPINELDLENADVSTTYEEIEPLVQKIRTQNVVIKKQIKELKRTQAEFTAITKNMKEGLLIIDQYGKILSFNDSAKTILGISEIDNIKNIIKPFSDYIRSSTYGEHISEVIEYNDSCYELFSNPVYVDENVRGAVAVILDITEKHQREVLRREFSANVSHELKTPLAAILASAEVIALDSTPKDADLHFSKNIIKETNRLITLVNDIIKLSKLDNNTLEEISEKVDLHDIGESVVERLTPIAESNNVKLNLIGEKAIVFGVPAVLDEIVYNLVDNAIKYNKPKGKVDITIAPIQGKTTLIVEDTGIGISEENKDRIFERFYRVDKSHSKEVGGTGLGLSIVKHGVEHHNGKLSIESELGKGTKITVVF
ncbi:MAG: ATP-binding protein [Ruminococcus sp.]